VAGPRGLASRWLYSVPTHGPYHSALHDASNCVAPAQAFAAWQWANFWRGHIPAEKRALRVNLDETAICLFQGGGKGNLFVSKKHITRQHVPLGRRRAYLSHVAFICDDPMIQPLLPQVIIGNEHTLKARQLAALRASCPPRVHLLRRKSAWVNWALIVQIVGWLAAALAPFMMEVQPMLFLDACKAHLHARVFAACAACGLWAVVVPAKMTRLLQPLDTHAFLAYKVYLQKLFQEARIRTANGDLDVAGLLKCICDSIDNVLDGRPWAAAFDGDGWGAGQAAVRGRILKELEVVTPLVVSADQPTVDQLRCCFPKGSCIPAASIWSPLAPPAAAAVAPKACASGAGPRRSARLLAHGVHPPGPPVAACPSSLLGARAKVASIVVAPAAKAGAMPRAASAASLAKAGALPGILTRSRSRALLDR
jgi:hypothetical protein